METFTKLFGSLLVLVYHCFDRIVINGYLSGLSRPEQVVHFFRAVLGIPVVSKEVLSQRTNDYRNWVESFARNHKIPIEWAGKGVRKEDYVSPALRRMEKTKAKGIYFISKSMEQGRTFRISEIFGVRLNKKLNGKLATVIDQIEHGHHVFRAYWKHAFLKQYEKFSCFLRNELCSNNLRDFGLKKGLDHLDAVRPKFQAITDRFAGCQAQSLNVPVDFPLLQKIALPINIGSVRYPGIKIHDARIIRLLEILLHNGSTVGGWTPAAW